MIRLNIPACLATCSDMFHTPGAGQHCRSSRGPGQDDPLMTTRSRDGLSSRMSQCPSLTPGSPHWHGSQSDRSPCHTNTTRSLPASPPVKRMTLISNVSYRDHLDCQHGGVVYTSGYQEQYCHEYFELICPNSTIQYLYLVIFQKLNSTFGIQYSVTFSKPEYLLYLVKFYYSWQHWPGALEVVLIWPQPRDARGRRTVGEVTAEADLLTRPHANVWLVAHSSADLVSYHQDKKCLLISRSSYILCHGKMEDRWYYKY